MSYIVGTSPKLEIFGPVSMYSATHRKGQLASNAEKRTMPFLLDEMEKKSIKLNVVFINIY